MTVERVGPPDHISNLKKTERSDPSRKSGKSDSINVSQEAKSKAEIYTATEYAKAAPDVRADRIAEVKKKLADPNYPTSKAVEKTADKLLELFGL